MVKNWSCFAIRSLNTLPELVLVSAPIAGLVAALAAALDLIVAAPVAVLVANCRLGLRQMFRLCIEAVDLQFAGQRDRWDLNSGLCPRLDWYCAPGMASTGPRGASSGFSQKARRCLTMARMISASTGFMSVLY